MKTLPILIFTAGLGLAACSRPEKAPEPERLPKVAVRLVQPRTQSESARAPATIEPLQHATISTRVPARVKRVFVREGDAVKAGTVLVSLADDDLRAQLEAAKAALASADAHARRLTTLASEAAATKSELEAAQAQRAQAQAAVGAAEEALRYTDLRSPFAGRVQAKRVTEGDLVTPGTPLIEVEGSGLEVVATLAADEVAKIQRGQSLTFEVGTALGRAEVSSIAPSADPVAHRVEVRARVVQAPPELRAGSFARIELPAASSTATEVWVPSSALVQRGDLRGVFVAQGNTAELRWLLLGDPVEGAVAVRAGLKGDELLIDAPGNLKDGQLIEVQRAN